MLRSDRNSRFFEVSDSIRKGDALNLAPTDGLLDRTLLLLWMFLWEIITRRGFAVKIEEASLHFRSLLREASAEWAGPTGEVRVEIHPKNGSAHLASLECTTFVVPAGLETVVRGGSSDINMLGDMTDQHPDSFLDGQFALGIRSSHLIGRRAGLGACI